MSDDSLQTLHTRSGSDEANGLEIPQYESRDGLFEYREEKTMNHVRYIPEIYSSRDSRFNQVQLGVWAGTSEPPRSRAASIAEDGPNAAASRGSSRNKQMPSMTPAVHDWIKNQDGADMESEVLVEHNLGSKTRMFNLALGRLYKNLLRFLKTLP